MIVYFRQRDAVACTLLVEETPYKWYVEVYVSVVMDTVSDSSGAWPSI